MQQKPVLTVELQDGAYRLQWDGPIADATLFASAQPHDPTPRSLGPLNAPSQAVPFDGARTYFAVAVGDCAPVWGATRSLEILSMENFRDLGGYPTRDGRTVRWGRFFRSAMLRGLSPADERLLEGLRLAHVIDYRNGDEAAAQPDTLPANAVYRNLPAFPSTGESGRLMEMRLEDRMRTVHTKADAEPIRVMFSAAYAELPFHNDAYRHMLTALDDGNRLPMLQHCFAGKDRTGMGCALLLLALGVPRDIVIEDYMLSAAFYVEGNRRTMAAIAKMGVSDAALELAAEMMSVSPAMIGRALAEIDARYPNLEQYFAAEYGVDAARLARWRDLHTI